jgi:alpha-galactosidase
MEEVCPEAWLINFSNPLTRVMRALNKYSSIRTVGKCHQIEVGYGIAAMLLRDEYGFDIPEDVTLHSDPDNVPTIHRSARIGREYFRIKAIGLNHFTWMVDVRDRETGDDVYPLMRAALQRVPDTFEPLSMDLFRCFGYCPVPGDTHLAEFLPYTHDPVAKPWQRYQIRLYDWDGNEARRERSHDLMEQIATGAKPVADLREARSEGAVEFIEAIEGDLNSYDEAVNVTNAGAIPNLPAETVVELPALVNGSGVQALSFDPLPFPIAELCRREAALVEVVVDAAVCGDRDLALQALLLDPMINDIDRARNILDDYLEAHAQYLPQFR